MIHHLPNLRKIMSYTLLLAGKTTYKIESNSIPRVGETIAVGINSFVVTEVQYYIDLAISRLNRGKPPVDITVFCEEK